MATFPSEAYSFVRKLEQIADREGDESDMSTRDYLMQLVKRLQYEVSELRARVRALERRVDTVENCYLTGEGEFIYGFSNGHSD